MTTTTTTPTIPGATHRDDLAAATAHEAAQLERVAEAVRRAADDEELPTLRRAKALCGLAEARRALEGLLDRLLGLDQLAADQDL